MSMKSRIELLLQNHGIPVDSRNKLAGEIVKVFETAYVESVTKDAHEDARMQLLDEAVKSSRAQSALEMLGLPDLSSPHFDAHVIHTAFRLGLLKRA